MKKLIIAILFLSATGSQAAIVRFTIDVLANDGVTVTSSTSHSYEVEETPDLAELYGSDPDNMMTELRDKVRTRVLTHKADEMRSVDSAATEAAISALTFDED